MCVCINSSLAVDKLLSMGVNVTVYNGQLDLICCTQGESPAVVRVSYTNPNFS